MWIYGPIGLHLPQDSNGDAPSLRIQNEPLAQVADRVCPRFWDPSEILELTRTLRQEEEAHVTLHASRDNSGSNSGPSKAHCQILWGRKAFIISK